MITGFLSHPLLQLGQRHDLTQQRLSRLHELRCKSLYLLAKPFELATVHGGESSRGGCNQFGFSPRPARRWRWHDEDGQVRVLHAATRDNRWRKSFTSG